MQQDNLRPFATASGGAQEGVHRVLIAGMLSSDAGVLLLRNVEQRLSIATRLATCSTDRRDPNRDRPHTLLERTPRLRMFAIAAGYEDRQRRTLNAAS